MTDLAPILLAFAIGAIGVLVGVSIGLRLRRGDER